MSIRGFAVALALAGPATEAGAPPADASSVTTERLETVVLAPDFSLPGLAEELQLRLRGRAIVDGGDPNARRVEPLVWILVDVGNPSTLELRLITSDGRLFRRSLRAEADERPRVAAGAVANMVDAIEQHRLEPNETGVVVPDPTPPPTVAEPAPEPAPQPPESPPPDPVKEPPRVPPHWLGVHLHPTAALGIGPPTDAPVFSGVGATLGGDLVFRSHAIVRAAVRVIGTRAGGVQLTRIRAAVHGGYAVRRRRFEFAVLGGVAIEPMVISDPIQTSSGTRTNPAPLFAGLLGLEPSFVVLHRPDRLELLVGPTFELGYSFEARSPAGAVRISDANADPLLRAGGLELAIAVGLQTRFALGQRRAARKPGPAR